jgi:hypothetical protein
MNTTTALATDSKSDTKSGKTAGSPSPTGRRTTRPQDLAATIKGAADAAAGRVPEAASNTLDAMSEARRAIRSGTDEGLAAGTILSFALAIGLLIGRANRLLVLTALIPAAAMGSTLLERVASATRRTDRPRTTN